MVSANLVAKTSGCHSEQSSSNWKLLHRDSRNIRHGCWQEIKHLLIYLTTKLICLSTAPVVLSTLPYRYDLPINDSFNKEIAAVISNIEELCVKLQGVELLEFNIIDHHCFTQDGMLLSMSGKGFGKIICRELLRLKKNQLPQPLLQNNSSLISAPNSEEPLFCHMTVLLLTYNGLIYPHMYSNILWGSCTTHRLEKVFRLKKRE